MGSFLIYANMQARILIVFRKICFVGGGGIGGGRRQGKEKKWSETWEHYRREGWGWGKGSVSQGGWWGSAPPLTLKS